MNSTHFLFAWAGGMAQSLNTVYMGPAQKYVKIHKYQLNSRQKDMKII